MIWDFIYEGEFMGKPRMVRSDKWKKRAVTSKYWAMKDQIVLAAKKQQFGLSEQFIITFQIEMPKSWSEKKKKEMLGAGHRQRPDLDNLCKGLMDCLLKEDSVVWQIHATKYWSDKNRISIHNIIT